MMGDNDEWADAANIWMLISVTPGTTDRSTVGRVELAAIDIGATLPVRASPAPVNYRPAPLQTPRHASNAAENWR